MSIGDNRNRETNIANRIQVKHKWLEAIYRAWQGTWDGFVYPWNPIPSRRYGLESMDHLVSNIHCSVYREQVFLTWYSDIYVPTGACQHHLGLSQTCCSRVSHPQLAHEAWNNPMGRILSTKTGNLSELSSSVLCALSSEARFSMVLMIAAGKPWQNPKQSDYSSVLFAYT